MGLFRGLGRGGQADTGGGESEWKIQAASVLRVMCSVLSPSLSLLSPSHSSKLLVRG